MELLDSFALSPCIKEHKDVISCDTNDYEDQQSLKESEIRHTQDSISYAYSYWET